MTERWAASVYPDVVHVMLSSGPLESGVVSQTSTTLYSSIPPQPCCDTHLWLLLSFRLVTVHHG